MLQNLRPFSHIWQRQTDLYISFTLWEKHLFCCSGTEMDATSDLLLLRVRNHDSFFYTVVLYRYRYQQKAKPITSINIFTSLPLVAVSAKFLWLEKEFTVWHFHSSSKIAKPIVQSDFEALNLHVNPTNSPSNPEVADGVVNIYDDK